MTDSRELALLADGARMLAEARGLMEVRDVRSLAVAAAAYARAKDLGEDAIRSATRIVILSTVRIGEELIAGQERNEVAKAGGDRMTIITNDDNGPATLPELGISANLSSTAQRLARNPEAVHDYLERAAEPSLAGAVRAVGIVADGELDEAMGSLLTDTQRRSQWLTQATASLASAREYLNRLAPMTQEEWDRVSLYVRGIDTLRPSKASKLEVLS